VPVTNNENINDEFSDVSASDNCIEKNLQFTSEELIRFIV
jgi:hypothetical protein